MPSPTESKPVTTEFPLQSPPDERPVHLVIADISGFTEYIWAHRESLAHAQVLINDLLQAVLERATPVFELAKLEGDAVFLYCPASEDPEQHLAVLIPSFFAAFSGKQQELTEANLCHCAACTRIGALQLKVILHRGTALFYSLGGHQELSGPDVITVHRLTKNSVNCGQYLLATAAAYERVQFPEEMEFRPGVERYPDIGAVPVHLYFPDPADSAAAGRQRSFGHRFGREWVKYLRALPYRLGLRRVTLRREEAG